MAPTQSLVRARQKWGRALRTAPGKDVAIILDMAGNWERVGLPDDTVRWTLDSSSKAEAERTPWKSCKACFAIIPVAASSCPSCGRECVPERRREVKHQRGKLTEVQRSYGASDGEERSLRDRREVYWRCLVKARGRGWKIKAARAEYRRLTGFWVGQNEAQLEDQARSGCQHTTMEGGYCRFCGEPGGLLGRMA